MMHHVRGLLLLAAVGLLALASPTVADPAVPIWTGASLAEAVALPTHHNLMESPRAFFTEWMDNIKTRLRPLYADKVDATTAFDWIPVFLGDLKAEEGATLQWSTPCYQQASAEFRGSLNGQPAIIISALFPTAECEEEVYGIATIHGLALHVLKGDATVEFNWTATITEDEAEWIRNNGFRMMRLKGSVDANLESVLATAELFLPAELTAEVWKRVEAYNVDFLRAKAFYNLTLREVTDNIPDEADIQDGDFLGVLRLDGLDPMLAWAMGAHTGHTTIAMRFDGELYICESTTSSAYWPTNHIQRTPYRQWIAQAKNASYNVVHLPLNDEYRAKFNNTKATEWFLNVAEGLPYGYANMLFTWIDTPEANYPGTLDSHLHELLIGFANAISYELSGLLWDRALNKRLNTVNMTTVPLLNLAHSRNISFTELMEMPEQDEWQYDDGYNMVCDVLVCEAWKAGGLFGDLDFQCTEFTNWDDYTLAIFNTTAPPAYCQQIDPGLPFCQILGDYRMSLPTYNSRPMVAHMAERCPRGTPPDFDKPAGC
ncbi:uncharacterized protein MONBRDRAFT_11335 [Monosiga brevicollis MX1]|uniref:Uncharacterized protein n=1 Tax=Monosiga brevicollis TaxID=81824 RepID=A9V8Y0_MONBE|nr:uncharacterized protein MONBRDRAFT_11335 [Monosiga brevicollis MX1]EDQ85954.1 predicted protein [Monosiga brevicollis MX1]|eukprot:XP_001749148.1 hypothetical protein [Monosiga brevicollis MX1]